MLKPDAFRNRVNQVLAEERKNPLGLWYLSYAGEEGWRGAIFIEAHGMAEAAYLANHRKLNPGGEVMGVPVPEEEIPAKQWHNRLLTKAELEAATGEEVATIQEWVQRDKENDETES